MTIPPRFFVVLLLCVLAPVAWADGSETLPVEPNALAHYTQGNRLYRLRKFGDAIVEYQAGAMIEPTPVFDYNLGQCYRQIGKYTEAIWHYERFLKKGSPDNERRASVTAFVIQMRAELDRKAMTQPPTDSASDPPLGQPRAQTSSPPTNSAIEQSGQLRAQAASPPPTNSSQPEPKARHDMSMQRKFALGAGAVGVAAIGLGAALGLRALSFQDDAGALCPMESCARSDEANKLIERGQKGALYANVAFGVGGTAILSAIVLWVTGSSRQHMSTAIVSQVSGAFTGVAATLKF